jgi:hypothetical protein
MRALPCLLLLGAQLSAAAPGSPAPNAPVPLPEKMRFCGMACFDLALTHDHYEVVTDGKVTSVYTVESFTPDSVILQRQDVNGATAVLRGSMAGDFSRVINGEAEWLTPQHVRGPFQLSWGSALQAAQVPPIPIVAALDTRPPPPPPLLLNTASAALPAVIHVCAQICMTLEPRDGHYISTSHNSWDPPGFHSVWAFESFTPQSVIVHRYDPPHPTNPGGLVVDVTYQGQMSSDGTLLLNPTINGKPASLSMGWGASLGAVPGNDAEQKRFADQRWQQSYQDAARKRHAQQVALAMPIPAACQPNPAVSAPSGAVAGFHLALCECESADCPGAGAAIWTLDGKQGSALWAARPVIADLTVERFDQGGVVIRRQNRSSDTIGLTAVYSGTLHGNEIDGEATWTWSGFKGGAAHGPWHAYIVSAEQQPVLAQYQQDVEQAVIQRFWSGLADVLNVVAAVGGAAGTSDNSIPAQVHRAVYDGPERRAQPR